MKNVLKIFAVVLVAAAVFLMVSCQEKGGTIEVENKMATDIWVVITKGESKPDLSPEKGDIVHPNETRSWDFDEDGIYTVGAISLTSLPKWKIATLLAGNTEKVTFKD
jgi:hypothetical protein